MHDTPTVLVLGGNGFIGRHAVKHLLANGAKIVIGSRKEGSRKENPSGSPPQRQLTLHDRLRPANWAQDIEAYDCVLNCVGILRQRPAETYDAIHHQAPAALSQACADAGIRFVHVSALGLSPNADSRFITSKYRGEQAIAAVQGDWMIARPSLLDGEGGFGAAWLRSVARLPFFIVPTSAQGDIAALTVNDAGQALSRLCLAPSADLKLNDSRIFELGGEHLTSFEAYIRGLRRRHTTDRAVLIRIPGILARLGAHICDILHFSPFSFGHWELLCHNNKPIHNRLPFLLGRAPTIVTESI